MRPDSSIQMNLVHCQFLCSHYLPVATILCDNTAKNGTTECMRPIVDISSYGMYDTLPMAMILNWQLAVKPLWSIATTVTAYAPSFNVTGDCMLWRTITDRPELSEAEGRVQLAKTVFWPRAATNVMSEGQVNFGAFISEIKGYNSKKHKKQHQFWFFK